METSLFTAIGIVCGVFVAGEILAYLTKYKLPALVTAMFIFIIFGGQLGIIPADTLTATGFCDITYTWGLPFLIAGFGTSITLKGLKSEGRACAVALCTVVIIVGLGFLLGLTSLGLKPMVFGTVEVAGGGQAAMIFIDFAKNLDDARLIALVLCVMNMQFILGYPLCHFGLRKSMRLRIKNDQIPVCSDASAAASDSGRSLIPIPAFLKENLFYMFFVLALICKVSEVLGNATHLSPYIFYIILGFLAAEIGLLEHNCLVKTGCMNVLMTILYLSLMADFVTMKIGDVGAVAIDFFIVMAAGLIGCIITGVLMGKLLKTDTYEAFALSIACMVGYPVTVQITEEALTAVRAENKTISDDNAARLKAYYEPKVVISGIVSISLVTGLLAGVITSFL